MAYLEKQNNINFPLNINSDDWIEALIPHADRYKSTPASIFAFCRATVTAGGGNLQDIHHFRYKSTTRRLKLKAEVETADIIKRNFDFPPHVLAQFGGKRRKQRGKWKDFLAVCATGTGLNKSSREIFHKKAAPVLLSSGISS